MKKVLLISEVPVENTMAGSALLYRLFETLDPKRLIVYEFDTEGGKESRRLSNVQYRKITVANFLRRNRFTRMVYGIVTLLAIPILVFVIERRISRERIVKIVTVTHGLGWLIAYRLSKRLKVPLILILHDEVTFTYRLPALVARYVEKEFGLCYKEASERFCVSPYMEDYYFKKFQVHGMVLYPIRSPNVIEYDTIADRVDQECTEFTIAYAGSIATDSYARTLALLANTLQEINGKLILFSPVNKEILFRNGLLQNNIEIKEFLPTNELVLFFRRYADALFVPMAFDKHYELAFELNFPSKLTDYTLAGLPIIISGPLTSSAIKWACDNKGVAVIIHNESLKEFRMCLNNLIKDKEMKRALAEKALEIGDKYFSFSRNISSFREKIV